MSGLTIGGNTFRVVIDGDATRPALVLSNSLGTDLSMWEGQVAALARHFRVIRYDTRGHGGSGGGDAPTSIGQLGRDVLAILDALEIDRVHWVGLSMGGAIGLWLLTNAPERIDRAVLANTAAKLGTPETWNARIASVLSHGMTDNAGATIERWFSKAYLAREPQRVATIHDMLRNISPQGYAACCAALRDMDLRAALHDIDADVLVLTGTDDPVIPPEATRTLLDGIVGAQHVELPARHMSSIEAEAAFGAAVIAFLTTKPAARPKPRRTSKANPAKATPVKRTGATRRSNAARAPLKAQPAKSTPAKRAPAKKAAARATPKKKPAAAHRRPAAKTGALRRSAPKAVAKKRPAKAARKKAVARRPTPIAAARRPVKAAAKKAKPNKAAAKVIKKAVRKAAAKGMTKKLPIGRRKAVTKPRRPTGRRKP